MTDSEATPILLLQPHGNIPNNQVLPLLLYKQVFTNSKELERQFKDAFRRNNWGGSWTNGVFDYHHYHSKSHEVLGVIAGSATLVLGGPGGEEVQVQAGDMLVLPAGTGHCRQHASSDFKVVGAYPKGQEDYDICTEDDDAEQKKTSGKYPCQQPIQFPELTVHYCNTGRNSRNDRARNRSPYLCLSNAIPIAQAQQEFIYLQAPLRPARRQALQPISPKL